MSPHRFSTLTLVVLLLSAGCKDREISAYRAPKDPTPVMPAPTGMANTNDLPKGHPPIGSAADNPTPMGQMPDGGAPPVAPSGGLVWTAPVHWQPKAPGSMRKGSYAITGDAGLAADLAITAFPGDTGGLFANINRWRGQVGLPPIEEAQLGAATEHLEINGLKIELVRLTGVGTNATGLLGAIVPFNGQTWFFKLMGPEPLVAREPSVFREFLHTIKPR